MPITYEPWQVSRGADFDILGRSTQINPGENTVPPFRGVQPQTELGVHGSFDSPENTAQTSPGVFTMACKISRTNWDTTVADLKSHMKKVVLIKPADGSVSITLPTSTKGAYSEDYSIDTRKKLLQAIALTASDNSVDTLLVSLMPTCFETSTLLHDLSEPIDGRQRFPSVGVLMSFVPEKSSGQIHITMAIEHAVEIKIPSDKQFAPAEPILFSWN
tara:strand:- start:633 stop:1283 length:651 start_codon:yes stop_codon:yes gene_type:complete